MNEASAHAAKLAAEHGIDLSELKGSGNEGLITKADVENAIAAQDDYGKADNAGHTNIMDALKAQKAVRAKSVPSDTEVDIALPSSAELMEIIAEMRSEIETLRTTQAGLIDREQYGIDLTDDMFFICKPNGNRWEERRIINKKTVVLEMVGSAFYGPFEEKDQIESYLKAKRTKREDSWIDWDNVKILTGREARTLDRQEKEAREAQFRSDEDAGRASVLDQRMWADHNWGQGSQTGVGTVIGPAK